MSALATHLKARGPQPPRLARATERAHRRRAAFAGRGGEELPGAVAIVGMAGRFPGARSVEEFWRNLRAGVESVSFFSDEELTCAGVDPAAARSGPTTCGRAVSSRTPSCSMPRSSASARARPGDSTRSTASSSSAPGRRSRTRATSRLAPRPPSACSPAPAAATYLATQLQAHPDVIAAAGRLPVAARQRQGLPGHARLLQAEPARAERERADRLLDVAGGGPPGLPEPARRRVRHGAGRRRLDQRSAADAATSTRRTGSSRPTGTAAPSTPRRAARWAATASASSC